MDIVLGIVGVFVVWAVMRRGGRHNRRNWKW